MAVTILFMLPLTGAVYDFRTDLREDTISETTANLTADNVTLLKDLYADDINSVSISSNLTTDTPLALSYNATRLLFMTGLTDNTTRLLTISYDIDVFGGTAALNRVADIIPFIWMLSIIAFTPAALFAIFTGRV